MICSVLIPSRGRYLRLCQAVQSIKDTAADFADVEVLVRADDDDAETIAVCDELLDADLIDHAIVGSRLGGYGSLYTFYDELAQHARGRWIWIMNDDAKVTGHGWDQQLAELSTHGLIVQPEIYQLNASAYPRCEGGAFPIVPSMVWRRFGVPHMGSPVDTWLDEMLRLGRHRATCAQTDQDESCWRTHFLPGIAVVHDRDRDDVLADHRHIEAP